MVTSFGLYIFAPLSVILLALFLRERRNRRRTEQRLSEALGHVSADTLSLHALENEVLDKHSQEQRRISNELHNGVSQNLAGIAMLLKGLEGRLQDDSSPHAKDMSRIAELIHKTSAKAQDLALGGDRDSKPAKTNLGSALENLAAQTQLLFRIPCRFEGVQDLQLDAFSAHHLLAIAREAIANAIRHAQADNITVQVHDDGETLTMAVEDDGRGLGDQTQNLRARGQRVMTARSEKIEGRLKILPRTSRGTRVECRIPTPVRPEES